jgi:uncharacterized protein YuzE
MDSMNAKIDDLIFDCGNYDAEGNVLYLARGTMNHASDVVLTREGHGVRYDENGEVIGVTLINPRRIIERDGHLTITLPNAVRVQADELATAFG